MSQTRDRMNQVFNSKTELSLFTSEITDNSNWAILDYKLQQILEKNDVYAWKD